MRISHGMGYTSIGNTLARLQEQNYKNNLKEATGADIISISDAPSRLMDLKKLTAQINMKENYLNGINYAVSEMHATEDQASAIAETMREIKDLSITTLNVAYDGNVASIGTYVKGLLSDMIRNANQEFNGKHLFSGTKTTSNSIAADYPDMNNLPFELVEGEPTPDNPSGLSVVFKGNTDNRTINKDAHTQEVINMNAEQLFGENGTEYFQPIIDLYNTLQYTRDGVPRESLDSMDREEKLQIDDFQQQIALNIDSINKNTAMFASRRNRLEAVGFQMTEEITRLDEVKSLKGDADMTKVLSDLKKEETTLSYALSAIANMQKYSLFDFLQ
jgi:flagellin-like hook-associated protein FlgL